MLGSIAIRLPALLGDGLWRDEANVYVQLSAPDFGTFMARVMATEWHPPLYFLAVYGWSKVAGTGELALELLPFACSVLTVWLVYRLGRALAGERAGLIAGGLYAVAPLAVTFSSEYVYPAIGLTSTLLALLAVDARSRLLSPARCALLAAAACAVTFTHYTGLLYVPLVAAWAALRERSVRRRLTVAGSLLVGMLPFAAWLPVFLAQRRIGVPYRSAPTLAGNTLYALRALAEFVPVRPRPLQLAFVIASQAALAVLLRARALERGPLVPAAIFLIVLAAEAAQNLTESRYALPYFGLACVSLGWAFARAGTVIAAASPAAWRRWERGAVAAAALLLIAADVASASATSARPKSGIRELARAAAADGSTLYVLAPDYLAATFAFYTRAAPPPAAGFVRWREPEVFRLAGYAADWNAPDAVDRTLRAIASAPQPRLDVIVDVRARDAGRLPYGKVAVLLDALRRRYHFVSRTPHPGRYEDVCEYRFALAPVTARF